MAARDLTAAEANALGLDGVAAASTVVHRYARGAWWLFAVLGVAVAWAFHASLGWLWETWLTRPEYSHGPILPLVALFLVWQQRAALAAREFSGSGSGVAVVALAAGLFALGVLGAVYTLQQYAFVTALVGLGLALTGVDVMRRLAVPCLLLYLMIPPPNVILNNLSGQLQLISSALGVALIRAAGISVFLEGNVIDLGGYRLQVVEACDGMRYLFPLMTIGLLIAYFYQGALWKRVLVFVASVPITVLMNSLRVGTIGILVEHFGARMADGFLHEFQGWMVFMLSAALLVGLAAALNRLGGEARPWRQVFGLELAAAAPGRALLRRRPLPLPFLLAAAGVGLLALLGSAATGRADHAPPRAEFVTFPMRLGGLHGERRALDRELLGVLDLDDYLLADYAAADGASANVYISYYSSQRNRRVVHSPRACIPGGGWQIEQSSTVEVPGAVSRANRLVIASGDTRELVYYWFDQRGRVLASEWTVKWFLFWDAVTRSRTDGAMVRLVTPLGPHEEAGVADQRLRALAVSVTAQLAAYVPH